MTNDNCTNNRRIRTPGQFDESFNKIPMSFAEFTETMELKRQVLNAVEQPLQLSPTC